MTFSTSVPAVQFTETGVVIPLESAILAGVQADIDTAFGGGVNPGLTTPQGQLAQSLTAIVGDKNSQIAEVANQVNPDVATGRWQDAIGRIYFLDRIAASGTVVTATCRGLAGTVLPAGSQAQDSSGYIYASTAAATIGTDGSVAVQFQNSQSGPIPCEVGALSTIYGSVIGWESIANTTAGTLGTDVETRADFEQRRRNSVALNAVNSTQAVYAAVLDVENVIDALVVDNPQGAPISYGSSGYPIAGHSICASVAGGSADAVAAAIWRKKSQGCGYSGNTTVEVADTVNFTTAPYPTYPVTFLVPAATPAFFTVQIVNSPALPANIATLIRAAVIAAFAGEDGGTRARIGSTIYSGRYFAGVTATDPNVQILSITMGLSAVAAIGNSLAFGIDQLPTLSASDISVLLV